MTAEIELLPLHDGDWWPATLYEMRAEMQACARANVEHAIAPLQAEIEALRAVAGRLKSENVRIREALQAIVDEVSDGLVPYSYDSYLPAHLVEQARAALAQEE